MENSVATNLKNIEKFKSYTNLCIKCGFCANFCPIYNEEKKEGSVARGKNQTIRAVAEGKQEFSKEFFNIIDNCLLCKSCVENCPAKSRIDHAVTAARADYVDKKGLQLIKRLAFKFVLSNRPVFGLLLRIASWFQFVIPKSEGKFRHLPDFLPALMAGRTIPNFPSRFLRRQVPERNLPKGAPRYKIGFFSGCATEFVFPETGSELVKILTDLGCEVIFDRRQGCCGAPVYFSGDFKLGKQMALQNIAALEKYDYIITGCATCGSALKDYPVYLADTDEEKKRFEAFSKKMKDFSEFIIDILAADPEKFEVKPEYQGKKVTWHTPCHLGRHQEIKEQPRKILKALKNITYIEAPNADKCCGMGGSYTITHHEVSNKIANRKATGIASTGAEIVVTACPGCVIQIKDALARQGVKIPVIHIAELFKVK